MDDAAGSRRSVDHAAPRSTGKLGQEPTGGGRRAGRGYDAFISYSHAADGTLAPAVQHGLEALAKPLYQRRALRVFRDQTSLAVTPALWPTIQQALEASRFFILLASPAAAQSHWVQQELAWWMQHREPGTLLVVLTAGTIGWDAARGDFAWPATDALPRGLSGWFREEPLWVDLRWARETARLSSRNPRFQDDVATLAAPLRGIPKDDLVGRDIALHRRTVRLTQTAVALLVLLTLGTTGGALAAINQRNTARRQTRLAESRAMVNAAGSTASTQLDTALLLAERAAKLRPAPETRAALLAAVTASPQLVRFVQQRSAVSALTGLPGGGMAVGHAGGAVSLLDAQFQRERSLGGTGQSAVTALALSRPAGLVVAADQQGMVRLWSLASGGLRWRRPVPAGAATALALAPDGTTMAIATKSNALVVLDTADGSVRGQASTDLREVTLDNLVFLDNQRVLVGDEIGDVQVWNVDTRLREVRGHGQLALTSDFLASAWSGDGRTYAITTSTHEAFLFDAVTGRQRGPALASAPPTAGPMAVDDRGDRAAFLYRGSLSVLGRSPQAVAAGRTRVDLPGFSRADLLAFSPGGRWLLAAGGATIAVFDMDQRARLATELPIELGPLPCRACSTGLAVDPLGRSVAWTDGPRVICWDLRTHRQRSIVHSTDLAWGIGFTQGGTLLVVSTGQGLAASPTQAGCPTAEPVLRVRGAGFSQQLWPVGATRMLTWGSAGLPQLVDLDTGRQVRSYQTRLGSGAFIGDVAVSSDARTFAVSVSTGDIRWYDVASGAQVGAARNNTATAGALAFVPGSRRVARTTATSIQLWDRNGRLVGQFDGSAQRLAFSADAQLLLGLDNEEVLRVWDVPSLSVLGTLQALPLVDDHGNPTAGGAAYGLRTGMGLAPDGTLWLVAASARPTGWPFSLPVWDRLACTWAGRSLSHAEWARYVGTAPPANLSCTG